MTKPPTKRVLASVQQHYVHAREILGDVLCLVAPHSPTRRVYRAVLEVSLLNFLLKAEEEQDALIERYRSLLRSLTFPVQLILRNERLDLRPYLARLHAQIPSAEEPAGEEGTTSRLLQWQELTEDLEELLLQVGTRHTLIERHCYLVVPAPDVVRAGRDGWLFRKTRRRGQHTDLMTHSLQDLALRVEMLQTQLAALGLRSRRLAGEELVRMYVRFLSPTRAFQHPLQRQNLAAVGHLPTRMRPPAAHTPPVPLPVAPADHAHALLPAALPLSSRKPRRHARAERKRARQERALPPPDLLRLADLLAPGSIAETWDALQVDGEYVRGLAVTAFPREVSTSGWLAPLLMLDEMVDLCWHLHPQNQAAMMRTLKRRRVGYASTRALNRQRGRLHDPELEVAQTDVARLMSELASGTERLFELSFLLLVRAPTRGLLDERTDRVLTLLRTVFLDAVAHPTTFEHAQAFRSVLPEGRDEVRRTITLDTASLATTFPFISNALTMPNGTFLGVTGTGEPVLLDPWDASLENPHAFVGGVTGAGKSYLGKLWLERSLLLHGRTGERCWVIDPDGEYGSLVDALGGTRVRLAPGSTHHLNPFDLIPPGCAVAAYLEDSKHGDRLAEKILDLQSLLDLMLADHGSVLGAREKALLDRVLYECYRRAGISADPRTHYHQPPLLRDLAEVLRSGVCGNDDFDLGLRLSRYVEGSLAGLFAKQTNVSLDTHLLVWDVREMRGDLRPVGIFLIADGLWTQAVYQSTIRRALYLDEAASLIEHAEGGKFLASLSRRARKRYLRLVVMTQTPEAFVQDEWGSVVATNAAIKILKKQDGTSVKAVASRFGLTAGEAQRLLTFGVQEALVFAGDRRVLLSVQASFGEHEIMTTNPIELARRAASARPVDKHTSWMPETPLAPVWPVTEDEDTIRRVRP